MKAVSRWIGIFEKVILAVTILTSVALSMTGVFFRYVLNSSLGYVEEVAGFLLLMAISVGIGAAVRAGSHLRVDMLIQFFPKTKKGLNIYAEIIALIVMSVVFVFAIEFLYQLWDGDQRTTSMWWLPVYIPLIIMPIGYITAIFRLVESLRTLIKTPGAVDETSPRFQAH